MIKTNFTTSTRWGCQHGLGNVAVLHYYTPKRDSHWSDYFNCSIESADITYTDEKYLYIYNDNGTLKLYDMISIPVSGMIEFKSGVNINGISIIAIEEIKSAMYPDKPYLDMWDTSYKVTYEFLPVEK